MSVDRRFLLKSMALGSVAGLTLGRWPSALAAAVASPAAAPLLALSCGDKAATAFLAGANAAAGSLQTTSVRCDPGFMLSFERQLRSGGPLRVIGLLDDASATLLLDMARSSGARVSWLGHHTAAAGHTTHRLSHTAAAAGRTHQFGRALPAGGDAFSVFIEPLDGTAPPRQLTGAPRSSDMPAAHWASSLGFLLASPAGVLSAVPPLPATTQPLTGNFVSISIEV